MAPPERSRRSTQRDIARRAGVSQATVSLVISGGAASTRIAEPTRRAVLAAAEELGYAANVAARSLKGGRNRLLGLYTFEPVFPTDQRDFYYPFLLGVADETARQGYDLLLFSSIGAAGDRTACSPGAPTRSRATPRRPPWTGPNESRVLTIRRCTTIRGTTRGPTPWTWPTSD